VWGRFGPWEERWSAIVAEGRALDPDVIALQETWRDEERTQAGMLADELAYLHWAPRQGEALSEVNWQPFEEAFAEVLKTPAGRRLGELADGPHRYQRAAEWQGGSNSGPHEARRQAHLRSSTPEGDTTSAVKGATRSSPAWRLELPVLSEATPIFT
jgi:hypothetical protein